MKISYSYGIVDLFHYGHLKVLKAAKKDCDLHIFGLVADNAAEEWIGNVISNYDQRKSILESLDLVDEVIMQKNFDPYDNLYALHSKYPDATITLYHGNNFKIIPAEGFLNSIGGKVVLTEYFETMSPENILNKLKNNNTVNRNTNNLISTKANTLLALKPRLKKSYIEDIYVFTTAQFFEDKECVLNKIEENFPNKKIILRSSSLSEDCFDSSNAGHFDSVLDIDSTDKNAVTNSILRIIDSYKSNDENVDSEQILVQSMTTNVKYSGVLFTRELGQNRPYYLINYDDSGSTDSVTAGLSGKTIWISLDADIDNIKKPWNKLIESACEVRDTLGEVLLDIEFAILQDDTVVIFQARPLAANYKIKNAINDTTIFEIKQTVKDEYLQICKELNYEKLNLSDMAFWNPSEIIGSNPKNLDYSLYREIITKSAWDEGIRTMGYTPVTGELMFKLGNKPYISLEHTFMSLIPDTLNANLKLKLLEHYIKILKLDTSAHDKVEFEIILSCFDFETENNLTKLSAHGFTNEEINCIRDALKKLTNETLNSYFEVTSQDLHKLQILEQERINIETLTNDESNVYKLIQNFDSLINSIKMYGTPQFSRQARYAFISRAMLKTLVSRGYFQQEAIDGFMLNIETVASLFEVDFNRFLSGEMPKQDFNLKYGHLRAGTYDITAKRYDHIDFNVNNNSATSSHVKLNYELDLTSLNHILKDYSFDVDAETFMNILKESIVQREAFKFEFTKSLSLAIELIAKVGDLLNLTRGDMAYLEIPDILSSSNYTNTRELKNFFTTIIKQRRIDHKQKSQLVFPEVLFDENEMDYIHFSAQRSNFITTQQVSADTICLGNDSDITMDISNKIVITEKADPGFDWIFTQGIKGLITKYGGAASHMAIRCAEFGIPAAIGCGEKTYSEIVQNNHLYLDCKNKKIHLQQIK